MHGILGLRFLVRNFFSGALRTSNDATPGSAMMLLRNLIMALYFAFLEVECWLSTHTKKYIHSTPTDRPPT